MTDSQIPSIYNQQTTRLWSPDLDALVAAPNNHSLVFENDRVRVLETHVPPGERTPVHTHRWPAVLHVTSWSDFIRYDDQGNILLDTREAAPRQAVSWAAPFPPHSLENIGENELRVLAIEIKDRMP